MKRGELVLAHDGGGDREATVDAVIAVVSERLAAGWRFTLPRELVQGA
jgi:endo-1,4-beta-xylanase